jgi:hypothetical protein
MRSELIDERHLARLAIIYIRQSSPHQVLTNQESLRLQYDLRRRALDLGWREADIVVIDADLGLSGAAAAHREGFNLNPAVGPSRPSGWGDFQPIAVVNRVAGVVVAEVGARAGSVAAPR